MMENDVPYIAYEASIAREERHIKRLVIALIIAIVLMFTTNAMWLVAWLQYDYSGEETTTNSAIASQDGEGINIVGNGDINYGADGESN